jgi:hypothetical protein
LPCATNDEDVGRTKMTELFGVHLAAPESLPADVLADETVYELRWLRQLTSRVPGPSNTTATPG